MPIYEYQCQACTTHIEVMQKSTDPAPEVCQTCGKGPMIKQLSKSSFALKGTGWYVTDFKGGSKDKSDSSSPPSSTPPAKPSSSDK